VQGDARADMDARACARAASADVDARAAAHAPSVP
jgi:hypothetical protein